jgi:hypothetical protein
VPYNALAPVATEAFARRAMSMGRVLRAFEAQLLCCRGTLNDARLQSAHFARLRLGLRCVLEKPRSVVRALLGPMLA